MLLVLGGFTSGVVLVFSNAATAPWYTHPALLLILLWSAVFGSIAAVTRLSPKAARRTQLSTVMALMIVQWLAIGAHYVDVPMSVDLEENPDAQIDEVKITLIPQREVPPTQQRQQSIPEHNQLNETRPEDVAPVDPDRQETLNREVEPETRDDPETVPQKQPTPKRERAEGIGPNPAQG